MLTCYMYKENVYQSKKLIPLKTKQPHHFNERPEQPQPNCSLQDNGIFLFSERPCYTVRFHDSAQGDY